MKRVMFNVEDCKQIEDILNATEPQEVQCSILGKTASFEVPGSHDVLTLLIAANQILVVDIVVLSNQRKGTWTNVFHYLVDFCRRNQITSILIPAVLTAEMVNWCEKNGLKSGEASVGLGRQYQYDVQIK